MIPHMFRPPLLSSYIIALYVIVIRLFVSIPSFVFFVLFLVYSKVLHAICDGETKQTH